MSLRVVVLGAGAVGASIAASLAERGVDVTLIDQGAPGSGTSSTTFGWVNSNGKEPDDYFEINRAGLEAHHKLAGNSAWLGIGGHVEIAVTEEHQARLDERISRLRSRDYPAEVLTLREARTLLPDVRIPTDAKEIAYFPRESYAYAALYIANAVGRARAAGAQLILGKAVVGLATAESSDASVLLADGTFIHADVVVSAVGRWTRDIAAMIGADIPMLTFTAPGDDTVGYLVETGPLPLRLDQVVTSPQLNFRPSGGGRLLLQALDLDVTADPTNVPTTDSPLADEFMRRLRSIVDGAESAKAERLVVGQRAMPSDGRTIAGTLPSAPWLYMVATHSGITLAPFLGEAVADEILGKERLELDPFRPDRFQGGSPYILTAVPRRPGEQ